METDPSILHELAIKIYHGAMVDDDLSDWVKRIIFVIPRGVGGIAFTVDPHNDKIVWFDGYHPGYLPKRKTWRAIAFLLMSLGFKYAATYTENQMLQKYHLQNGMQELDNNIFSIGLEI